MFYVRVEVALFKARADQIVFIHRQLHSFFSRFDGRRRDSSFREKDLDQIPWHVLSSKSFYKKTMA